MANTAQELFPETTVEMSRTVPKGMSVDIRDRFIAHVIADLSEKVIRTPGTNPRGLTVTVTSAAPSLSDPAPLLIVVATAPMHV